MNNFHQFLLLWFSGLFWFIVHASPVHAYTTPEGTSLNKYCLASEIFADNFVSRGIDELIKQIEEKHGVMIFYKPEWFEGQTIRAELAERPMHEALFSIARGSGLEVLFLDDVIVFVKTGSNLSVIQSSGDHELIVGNPGEYGRYSRAVISGTVSDGATGETLIGAVVFEPESGRGSTTDVNGRFTLELPVGRYRLRLSYIGYEDSFRNVRLISDGQVEFELFSNVSQLDQVTITAQRARENVLRTQMSIVQLDAKNIKELPQTFGERDIVQSLTLLPGIQSMGEFGTGINVRGGSADQNLILIENVPLFNSSHLFGLISVINPDLVSDVTMMKASVPARYGERASAVMDVKLGEGTSMEKMELTGGIGILNSRLLFQTPLVKDKFTFSAGARSSYSDWLLRQIPDEDLMKSNAGFYDLTALSNVAINKNNYLTLFGYYSFDRYGFSEEDQHEYGNTLASLRWSSLFSSRMSSSVIMGWSNYYFQATNLPKWDELSHFSIFSSIDYKTLKWNLLYQPNLNHDISFGFNAIAYGIEPGNKNPVGETSVVEPWQIKKEQALELAVYAGDDFAITERINLDVGFRFTQYLQMGPAWVYLYQEGASRSIENIIDTLYYDTGEIASSWNGLEPRIGLRYQIDEYSSVKASYNRLSQYLNLVSNTSVMAPTDLWKLSDTHLKPLRSDHYAVGYFRNFLNNSIETSAEVYYKSLFNAMEYRSGAEIVMNPAVEADLVDALGYNYGLELYVKKNSGRLTGWCTYTYSVSMRRTDTGYPQMQINNNQWFPSNYDRPHSLIINTNYHISRRWRFGATFTMNTGRPVTLPESVFLFGNDYLVHYSDRNIYRLPTYHRLDVSISLGKNHRLHQKGKGFWTFTVMNLYGRKNPYSVFYKKEPAGAFTPRSFNMYQMYIIGTPFPTITYNFSL